MAGIYAFNKTPIYEATALVEIGNYKNNNNNNNNNNNVLVDSVPELVKKLNLLFIEIVKNEKNKTASITSILTSKGVTGFLEINSEAMSNESSISEINKVVNYIQSKHQIIMNDVKNRRKLEIKNIQSRIDNIKNKEIKLLTQKINAQQGNLDNYRNQLNKMITNIVDISKTDPALTALKLMEKRDISTFVAELNLQLMDMRDKRDTLETTTINDFIERKKLVESMLLPHNYKNSEVIGKVITNDYPIKPKKKLIVAVAFIAGFILSIFLVFIMNAFRKEKNEKITA
jgi:uncharacterized protein involved in exopolysaccharide biosynthesis